MMKRVISLLLAALLFASLLPVALADATPRPITTVDYDSLPDDSTNGIHYYLLLCQDLYVDKVTPEGYPAGNTDGIVLVTLNTRAHRVMLTSIIRDALIVRPDGVIGRINYIPKNYGPEALCRIISTHLGVKVEKYILFNFSHIQNIIDSLGGVDITISSAEAGYLKRYPVSPTATSPTISGAGTYHFTGHAAMIYMRIRKAGGGGDFMRTQRVRTVLSTLADQCRNITYDDARTLLDTVIANSSMTNMSLEEMLEAMDYAYSLRGCTIEELRIPQDDAVSAITYAGMAVQEVDWEKSREDMADFLQNSYLVIDDDEDNDW